MAWASRRAAAGVGARGPSARPRRKASATAGTAGSCRARAAVASRSWSTGPSFLARPRFAHRKRAAFEGLLIEFADRRFRNGAIRVVHERESAGPAGFPVNGENDLGGFADAGKVLSQLCLGRGIRQVAYKQTD
jgi:hypothetical protein